MWSSYKIKKLIPKIQASALIKLGIFLAIVFKYFFSFCFYQLSQLHVHYMYIMLLNLEIPSGISTQIHQFGHF
jgi:hypothetical protein